MTVGSVAVAGDGMVEPVADAAGELAEVVDVVGEEDVGVDRAEARGGRVFDPETLNVSVRIT
ncbi:MAG: hypothetical protein WEB55_02195 [Acidimicrobiia bacterium]